jgi:hypothetical protein
MLYMTYQRLRFQLRLLYRLGVYMTLAVTLSIGFSCGCVERNAPPFIVVKVSPADLEPGGEITVEGRGFGEERSQLSVGGRSLVVSAWREQSISATLPLDVPTGARLLVVSRNDLHSPGFPIYIAGEGGERPSSRLDFSPLNRDMGRVDQGIDFRPLEDQMIGSALSVELDNPEATVIIEAERRDDQETPELWVSLIARNPSFTDPRLGWSETPLWGAASHLQYPTDRLDFIRMTLSPGTDASAVTGSIEGRVFWYHGKLRIDSESSEYTLITLRFTLRDPLDLSPIRLTIPSRTATLRGVKNQRLNGAWSGGVLSFSGVNP